MLRVPARQPGFSHRLWANTARLSDRALHVPFGLLGSPCMRRALNRRRACDEAGCTSDHGVPSPRVAQAPDGEDSPSPLARMRPIEGSALSGDAPHQRGCQPPDAELPFGRGGRVKALSGVRCARSGAAAIERGSAARRTDRRDGPTDARGSKQSSSGRPFAAPSSRRSRTRRARYIGRCSRMLRQDVAAGRQVARIWRWMSSRRGTSPASTRPIPHSVQMPQGRTPPGELARAASMWATCAVVVPSA